MDNRSVTFSGGNQSNINVNMGDGENRLSNVSTKNDKGIDSLFDTLFEEISKLNEEHEVQDALDNAKKMKDALEKEDIPRAKKIFNWLPTGIQASNIAIEISKLFQSNPS
ncbi:hypothetical protein ACUXCC_005572 [Cytobacillus horneckiae]|uniref:hypothetical protein n=1 Tax=Cytobacillus horneckiae TaxID=549687 RepID=UPI0019D02FE1|nr:hypothetical protein [Cytobacillus horneckiae]MBN6890055.1 hypothetical protein [Cytobacillus horneckiae]